MELLIFIEGIRTPFFDTFFSIITRLGEEMILIIVFCALYWCINKKMAYIIGVVFFMSALAVQGMKIVFRIARPWVIDPNFTTVEGAVREATGYSFPSGHTQNAASYLGGLGALLKPIAVKIILFTLAILVAFSRMYLGVHTLEDVLVSLLITFVMIFITMKVFDKDDCKKRDLIVSSVMVLFSVVVLIYAAVLNYSGVSEAYQLRDSVLAAGAAIGFAVGMFIERTYIRFSVKAQNIPMQIVKYVLGVVGIIAIQEGARIIGDGLIADGIRYFLMIMWPTAVYPLVIKRFFTAPDSASDVDV